MSPSRINYIIAQETGLVGNFYEDLNAMHEAEKVLDDDGPQGEYRAKLVELCDGIPSAIHATAKQRAEAFLRTIGKWEEEA